MERETHGGALGGRGAVQRARGYYLPYAEVCPALPAGREGSVSQ